MEIQLWREILNPYELAVKELTDKFNHLIREHKVKNLYSPIESVSGRVKSVTSILEKMQKKQIAIEQLEEQLEDIAGIRIICQFVEDIGRVAQIIRSRSDLTVKYEKDYIAHQKESGYRSFHMIIYYVVETLNGPKRIQAEIQIRTMAMDFWASLEHKIAYKFEGNAPENLLLELKACADMVDMLDAKMFSLNQAITAFAARRKKEEEEKGTTEEEH